MNIYVGNLSRDLTKTELREAFAAFGEVSSASIIKDKFSGETRGWRLILQDDVSGTFMGSSDAAFNRLTFDLRKYQRVFGEKDVFADTGTVWPSLREIDLGETAFDAGVGLRFYMPDFVVRVDVAWSGEGMGLYFNFGHIF